MFQFRSTLLQKEHVQQNLETCPGNFLEFYFAESVRTLEMVGLKRFPVVCIGLTSTRMGSHFPQDAIRDMMVELGDLAMSPLPPNQILAEMHYSHPSHP